MRTKLRRRARASATVGRQFPREWHRSRRVLISHVFEITRASSCNGICTGVGYFAVVPQLYDEKGPTLLIYTAHTPI